jgi:hypothetical protein
MANELGGWTTTEVKEGCAISYNCAAHPHLDSLKNIHLEFLGAASGHWNHKKCKYGKFVNYILEEAEENLLISSSTAREIRAWVNLLQALQFVANSWREISSKTIQNCFAHCGFKHSSLEIQNTTDIENEAIFDLQCVRNYEEFVCINNSLQCYNENEDCGDAVVEQVTATHQETSQNQETDEVDTPKPVTRMPGNVLLNYDAISCRKAEKTVLFLHYIYVLISFRCSQSRENSRVELTDFSNIINC